MTLPLIVCGSAIAAFLAIYISLRFLAGIYECLFDKHNAYSAQQKFADCPCCNLPAVSSATGGAVSLSDLTDYTPISGSWR